jgi:hypothetical protein
MAKAKAEPAARQVEERPAAAGQPRACQGTRA